MLRESCKISNLPFSVASVVDNTRTSGIEHYQELIAFADALLIGEKVALDAARDRLHALVGDQGVVRASAVVANFQMMNRALDTLGAQLGRELTAEQSLMAEELGLPLPAHWNRA